MPGPEPPRRSDFDDWFVGLGDETPPSTGRAPALETGVSGSDEPAALDDWVHAEPASTLVEERDEGRTVTLGALLVVAAIVVVLILVAGLAVGGVFSGGGKNPAKDATTALTTTQTQSTTPTTPARPARPVVSAPATTLKPGDQGVQVKRLQRALARLGYAAGAVDGDYGVSTQAALTRFQQASALTADGVLGPATLQALKRALVRHG
jgi:Putative peptidoglycan binding domain